MPNTAQRSAEYEILSLLRRRFCRWRRFFLHGVREESADCGRWSEKAKRETREVAKAHGKEAPQINLLGDRNRQNLTETIYTQETIFDNILEAQMEHAAVRDEVVSALLRLL